MKTIAIFAVWLAAVSAVPTLPWTPELGSYYAAVSSHINSARGDDLRHPPSCDLSKASLPTAPTPLPASTGKLVQVVVGRGVQNYTCSTADASAAPVAVGAVANLYNVSCIAANYPDVLQMLPNLALQYPLPTDNTAPLAPSNVVRCGHHNFDSTGVPSFYMDDAFFKMGFVHAKVANKTAAPESAVKGQNGVGYGSVPWLLLNALNTSDSSIKAVYRVNTAGGVAPANCSGSPATFSIQYAAEYWMYS